MDADGVRDVAVYVYIVIIFTAALFTSWQASIAISMFALSELSRLRIAHIGSPSNIARNLMAILIVLWILIYLTINTVRNSLYSVREKEEIAKNILRLKD